MKTYRFIPNEAVSKDWLAHGDFNGEIAGLLGSQIVYELSKLDIGQKICIGKDKWIERVASKERPEPFKSNRQK